MFLGMGPFELIVILVVVLVIFGPKNLPKLGKSLGQTVKNVREGMDEDDDKKKVEEKATATEVEAEVEDVEPAAEPEPAADAADKFCPSCGAKNPSSNAFCAKCGTKLQ